MIITDAGIKKIADLIKDSQIAMPDRNVFLRLAVQPGGCSGLRYQTFFDYQELEGDQIQKYDGFDIHIDKMSAPYLDGTTMDFVDTIEKQGFILDNPNATNSCACGDSFC
jgi:iron-sulfur cluster assembly accessory protein